MVETKMVRSTTRLWIGAVSAVLLGAAVAGCNKDNSNPDNVSSGRGSAGNAAAPASQANTASGTDAASTASARSFDDAVKTWRHIEEARIELDSAIKAKTLDQVHAAATKIDDLVKTLPGQSFTLPEYKRQTLDMHVRNVGELAAMMNKSDKSDDMKATQEHQTAMNGALDMIKGVYPQEAMGSSMHIPDMSSSGKPMSDNSMPGKGMGDKMSGMGDKMSGMGSSTDPAQPTDPDKMSDMDMMDKMTSGMSMSDKNEMKMTMDKMAAMPPAQRKKALQKMSGMGSTTDPAQPADPGKMPGDM